MPNASATGLTAFKKRRSFGGYMSSEDEERGSISRRSLHLYLRGPLMLFGCRERYAGLATLGLSENENHKIEESSDTYRWIHGLLIGFATPSRRGRNGARKECRSRRGSPPVGCSPCTAQVTNETMGGCGPRLFYWVG